MKKCPYCGSQMEDNNLFCTNCGKELSKGNVCPHCGASVNDGDAFCQSCGKKIEEIKGEEAISEEAFQESDVSFTKSSNTKIIVPIIITLLVLALIGGGWWSWKTSQETINTDSLMMANMDVVKEDVEEKDKELELIKDAYKSVLDKCSSDGEFNDLGTYFLYDISGDNIPELWVYADNGSDSNFHIYTFMNKQASSIYDDSFEPSRTSFGYGKNEIYVKTGGMGHEEWNLFKYANGKIEKKEVYSWSQNPANYEEEEVSGVEPECEDIKTYRVNDKTLLNKIGKGGTLIEVKTDIGNAENSGSSFKQYSDYVGTWKLNRTEAGQKMRMEVTLREDHSGEFVVFVLHGSHDEVIVYEKYPQCVLTDGIIYLTKNGNTTQGDVPKLKVGSDGLYSFDNEKYVRESK